MQIENIGFYYDNHHISSMNLRQNKPFGIVLLSIYLMAFMPFGTFDPTNPRFYLCIATAISGVYAIHKYVKKLHDRKG